MVQIGTRQEYFDKIWDRILRKEECPFCDENIDPQYTIASTKYWRVVHNKYPYTWTDKHIMAHPIRHIGFSRELNSDELADMENVFKIVHDFFGDEDYFSATRESVAHRSIEHLHIHFIPGKLEWKYIRCMLENQWFPIEAEVQIQK